MAEGKNETVDGLGRLEFSDAERAAMSSAIELARQGVRGSNPLVGAVLLDRHERVIATGCHRGAGTPHAEADAIAQAVSAGADLRGAAMIVSLEPCDHYGLTGPCTQAILKAGIRRLVYAIADPHQQAAGGSVTLREAGLDVGAGLLAEEATALNHRWLESVRANRPFITLRLAQTVDGQIAAADGSSQWISGPSSRADSHELRRRIDAILVGTGTINADNPRLTARSPAGATPAQQPLRVVMGLRPTPADAAVRGSDGLFRQLVTRSPSAAADSLYGEGVRHLMIEGGSSISGAFLRCNLVDEIFLYLAPVFLGRGIPALADLGIETLTAGLHWRWDASAGGCAVALGADLRLHLEPAGGAHDEQFLYTGLAE